MDLPDGIKEEWWGFHWLEHVTAIPAPLALVTGYKEKVWQTERCSRGSAFPA